MIKFKLKEIMENRGMKISDLNEITGISRNSLSLLINGKSQGIQFDTLERITNALKINISDLFEKTFDSLSIEFDGNFVEDINLINENLKYNNPTDFFNDERFKRKTLKTLQCKVKIDSKEKIHIFPYRIVTVFNPVPTLRIEFDLKNYDEENIFSYVFHNFEFIYLLFNYLATNKILESEKNIIEKLKNDFNLYTDILSFHNDLESLSETHIISINKNLTVNKSSINNAIRYFNESKLYKVSLENEKLTIKSIKE